MSRILVTGGAGFIGSHLVDRLIEQGHEVVIWDDLSTGKIENVHPKANLEICDIGKEVLSRWPFDVIFHLAAKARIQPSFQYPELYHHSNVMGTFNVLNFAKICGARVVYAGTSSLFHDPYANPYTFTKWLGEEYCKLFNKVWGLSVAITRFFNVYGPRQIRDGKYTTLIATFERQTINKQPLTIYGTGEKRRDFTHVSDIVDGLIAASKDVWNGEIFSLGRGHNFSVNEVAAMFRPEHVVYLDDRPGEALTTLADLEFTMKKLQWRPKMNLQDYVEEFLKTTNH